MKELIEEINYKNKLYDIVLMDQEIITLNFIEIKNNCVFTKDLIIPLSNIYKIKVRSFNKKIE